MPSANRCPECRDTIHPFAAICASCRADLDAHRRRRATSSARAPRISFPRFTQDVTDLVVVSLVLLLLALFAPLFGALFGLWMVWHAHHNGPVSRRNIAIFGVALSLFNIADPQVLLPHLI